MTRGLVEHDEPYPPTTDEGQPPCTASAEYYGCTRIPGHDGDHEAGIGRTKVASWPQEKTTEDHLRDLAALFRQFAAEEQVLIDQRAGHPVPGSIRQVVLAEAWTKAAGIVEQRLGGGADG